MMTGMALRDYAAWHDHYDRPGSALHLRLLVVQDLIASALDELPPGPVKVISMCAGQGRDLIGVARRHRRGGDLAGILVEADPRNVAVAREGIEQAGLDGLTVIDGDAGDSGSYAGAVPADLVLACGIFGNVSDEDIRRTVGFIPALCAPGAWVIWTRATRDDGILTTIQDWSAEAGFRPRALVVGEGDLFGVGAAVLTAPPSPYRPDVALFTFVQ
jgi:SAM-dependent methyltransferase